MIISREILGRDENIKKYVCTLSPQGCYDQDRSSQDSSKPTNIESQGKKNKGYIDTGPKQTQTATVMWEIFIQGCLILAPTL